MHRALVLVVLAAALLIPAAELVLDWGARTAVFGPGGLALHVFEPVAR